MRIELANYRAERRLARIGDSQYWAERGLIDAQYPLDKIPDWLLGDRVKALDEIYNDLMRRRAKRGEV